MELSDAISQMKALINTSLHYSSDSYDIERLVELKRILGDLTKTYSDATSDQKIALYFDSDTGYVTPKVDIRSVVFNDQDKLLLVKEKKKELGHCQGDGLMWDIPLQKLLEKRL